MRTYYLFKINDNFYSLYNSKTFYLYKMLEEISKTSENDFLVSYRLFEQLAVPYNKTEVNSNLYRKFCYDQNYEKILNKHLYDDGIEKTKLSVYNTYIKIKTNKNIINFFQVLVKEENIFVCDFVNKDYFWLQKVLKKTSCANC